MDRHSLPARIIGACVVAALAALTLGGAAVPPDGEHCAVGAAAMVDGESQPVEVRCFDTDEELWAFLTGGRIDSRPSQHEAARFEALAEAGLAPAAAAASVLLGVEYDGSGYGGSSRAFYGTSGSGCGGGSTYGFPSLGAYGWNDRVSSAIAYGGCRSQHYADDNYVGGSVTCTCSSMGWLDNGASSIVFRP